jgi:preprotein translocase subunit SecY
MLKTILSNLPEVKGAIHRLCFKEKLKWTLIILISFFVLSTIPLFGLGQNALQQFEYLSIILGAKFGSILSLGIGPIVTASIVLQLLTGSGILKLDLTTKEGKLYFQGLQKVLSIFFIIFESLIYVFMGGLSPATSLSPSSYFTMQWILVFQLFVGGMLILYMDEVMHKWGFGSGVSLFIAAGVSAQIFIRAFSPLTTTGVWAFGTGQAAVGKFFVFLSSLSAGDSKGAVLALAAILATILVFGMSVFFQAMKVEIPLSFGRIRGYGMRWPLNFLYTSNIPVILTAALMANVQLWARLMERWGYPFLGTFAGQTPSTGLVAWLYSPNIVEAILTGNFSLSILNHSLVYMLFMIIGATIFSIFWVQTAGMDAKSQAKQIMASGLQVPGFRRDERILESLLKRYIFPLTVMGAIAIGLLASSADLAGALSRGTGILLTVMIIYRFYEDIAKQHMMDMYPALRKMMGGS